METLQGAGNVRYDSPTDESTTVGFEATPPVLASWLRRYIHGESIRDLARDLPISHEWVRQLLYRQYGADRIKQWRANHRAMLARVEEDRVRSIAPPCQVCGEPNMRAARGNTRTTRTCSPACARLWGPLRYQLDEESNQQHRLQHAQSILRHPTKRRPCEVEWAHRLLADPEGTPPNRRFVTAKSIAKRVLYS